MAKILQWINYNGTSYELDGVAYAVCSTSGAAATKVADSENTLNFKLINGAKVVVKFSNAITSGTSSLQIGTTTPKVIKYNGSLIGPGMISNNQVCEFVYDSTEDAWLLVGGTDTGSGNDGSTSLDFRGTIQSNTALPNSHSLGMVYRVGADGVYAGQNCEIGDLIICINEGSSANNSDWTIIQKNVDGAVFKESNSFTDGDMLIADGTTGKVESVAINTTITKTSSSADNSDKLKVTVGGVDSNEIALSQATTAVYGVTKLVSDASASNNLYAATPGMVQGAITAKINTLDVNDITAETGKYISAVAEEDGLISATKANFSPSINKTSSTSDNSDSFTISVGGATSSSVSLSQATSSVFGVVKLTNSVGTEQNLAATPYAVNAAINSALNSTAYSDTAITGQYVSEVDQTNGTISVTRTDFNPLVSITPTPLDSPDLTPSIAITVGGASSSEVNLPAATTAVYGVTKLSNATNSQDSTVAASSKAIADKIKRLYLFDYYDEATDSYISSCISTSPVDNNTDTSTLIGLTQSEFASIADNAILNNELILLRSNNRDFILNGNYSYDSYSYYYFSTDRYLGSWTVGISGGSENNLATANYAEGSYPISNLSGTLPISKGGTGVQSFNDGEVLVSGTDKDQNPIIITRPIKDFDLTAQGVEIPTNNIVIESSSNKLITERTVYHATANINNGRQSSNVSIFAPITSGDGGTNNNGNLILASAGNNLTPVWKKIQIENHAYIKPTGELTGSFTITPTTATIPAWTFNVIDEVLTIGSSENNSTPTSTSVVTGINYTNTLGVATATDTLEHSISVVLPV